MRRLLAATVVTTVLLTGSGCSGDRADEAAPASPVGPSTAPTVLPSAPVSVAPAGGNGPQVCAEAEAASSTAVRTYVEELGKMIAAVGANDSTGAETARKRAESALTTWRTALRQQSAKATDPQLKTLLNDLATEVGTLGTDVESIDETELDRLQQRLDQLCGR
ncbi:hypothetical protein [Micromonospora halophytica]|uniref:Uncharacterized protein n=1 Tax=Micromonospora halophytica TaxID=47864 RepID=A0A1C5J0S8_9ACTN|nr:hypothetical protein [Micromonospora halophytica]SCG64174.1 hypothetical protein GA0070560_119107 [Micromonospora halophytica]